MQKPAVDGPSTSPTVERRRGHRPAVVTVAAVTWWFVLAVHVVVGVLSLALSSAGSDGSADGADAGGRVTVFLVGALVLLGVSALLAWCALRMWNGSRGARAVLAVAAGLGLVTTVVALVDRGIVLGALEPLVLAVAVVLSFLPAARPWFPPVPRPPREQQPGTVGWDPETGERIVERTDGTSPS